MRPLPKSKSSHFKGALPETGYFARIFLPLVIEMEDVATQVDAFAFELPEEGALIRLLGAYAKRVDVQPSDFTEVVEDIVFLW